MIVFSTVLEINGRPTLYSVYKNARTVFFNPGREASAPVLFATLAGNSWRVTGTGDHRVVQQVLKEIVD